MPYQTTKPEHEVAYQDLISLLAKYAGELTAYEMLAVAANVVGKLVALQDQREVTVAEAMEVIARNVAYGNKQVVDRLARGPSEGSA